MTAPTYANLDALIADLLRVASDVFDVEDAILKDGSVAGYFRVAISDWYRSDIVQRLRDQANVIAQPDGALWFDRAALFLEQLDLTTLPNANAERVIAGTTSATPRPDYPIRVGDRVNHKIADCRVRGIVKRLRAVVDVNGREYEYDVDSLERDLREPAQKRSEGHG